jgi:hypothetical protein
VNLDVLIALKLMASNITQTITGRGSSGSSQLNHRGLRPPPFRKERPEMENADIQKGRELERADIIKRLEYNVKEIRFAFADQENWQLVADFLEEEIEVIQTNEYRVR